MAVTIVAVRTGPNQSIATVQATADADVAAVIPHGLGAIPEQVTFEPLLAEHYLSATTVGVIDATNVNLVMENAVGAGAATPQLRVVIHRPHSLIE